MNLLKTLLTKLDTPEDNTFTCEEACILTQANTEWYRDILNNTKLYTEIPTVDIATLLERLTTAITLHRLAEFELNERVHSLKTELNTRITAMQSLREEITNNIDGELNINYYNERFIDILKTEDEDGNNEG